MIDSVLATHGVAFTFVLILFVLKVCFSFIQLGTKGLQKTGRELDMTCGVHETVGVSTSGQNSGS